LIGNTTGNTLSKATLTQGTGITITNGAGSITVTNESPNATHTGDVTGASALTISNDAVTFAKMQNISTSSLLGRVTASTGDIEELTATQVRTLLNVADGATANAGTVTSVTGTGTVAGLSLSGTVTSSGNITLGGTLAVTGDAFGSQTAKTFLAAPNASNGNPSFRLIVASDIPTLNQDTTGTASNVTGIVAIANGGTGASTAPNARTNLGATTLGSNLFTITNPGAITFPRFNADNTVSSLSDTDFRTAIGAGTGNGTVTSIIAGTGLSGGTITSTGTIAIDSTVATLTDTQTFTNKSISGSTNTFSNIANSSLTNSSITINGTSVSLGGSTSVGTVTSVSGTGTVSGITLSGSVTSSGNLTLGGAFRPISEEKIANFTLALADEGKVLRVNSSSNIVVTIPLNSAVAFPIDTEIALIRYGSGEVSVSPTGGVTLNSAEGHRKIFNRYGTVALKKIGTDEWILSGSLEA
jgi:hypothetical protein